MTENIDNIIENELNYISYKRTIQHKGDYLTHEMSANINPEVGYEATYKHLVRKVNWMLSETMRYNDSRFDAVKKYKENL